MNFFASMCHETIYFNFLTTKNICQISEDAHHPWYTRKTLHLGLFLYVYVMNIFTVYVPMIICSQLPAVQVQNMMTTYYEPHITQSIQ